MQCCRIEAGILVHPLFHRLRQLRILIAVVQNGFKIPVLFALRELLADPVNHPFPERRRQHIVIAENVQQRSPHRHLRYTCFQKCVGYIPSRFRRKCVTAKECLHDIIQVVLVVIVRPPLPA